jgi:hypothetical protein
MDLGAVLSVSQPQPFFHWAVRIGGFVYELYKGENEEVTYNHFKFAVGDWSTQHCIGETILRDEELAAIGMAFSHCKSFRLTTRRSRAIYSFGYDVRPIQRCSQ